MHNIIRVAKANSKSTAGQWQFWIDRGGTFTDVIGRDPQGKLHITKHLSAGSIADAAVSGMRELLGLAASASLPARRIGAVRMGTTVATNALLERDGAKVLLVVTRGFADMLVIRDQARPALFALFPERPSPLYTRVIEVDERVRADGTVERAPDLRALHPLLEKARVRGIDSVAVVCLHSHRYPAHEHAVAVLCRKLGFGNVLASSDAEPVIGALARGETAVADAYLTPLLRRHVKEVRRQLGKVSLQFMQSHGGLVDADKFAGRNAILSGPAGGVIGATTVAALVGFDRLVSFDMGGTSTDVAHYAGELERSTATEVAGSSLRTPMLRVHTVAAGGGSICWAGIGRLHTGPQSAGADPGPACYGRGGPLTITDCNLILGRLVPEAVPAVFGRNGDQRLDLAASHNKLAALARKLDGKQQEPEQLAADFLDVAVARMTKAVKVISVQRGHDLDHGYALVAFGGAGGQHACQLADSLGIGAIIIHPLAGLLSAAGIGLAAVRAVRQRSLEVPLAGNLRKITSTCVALEREAAAAVRNGNKARMQLHKQRRILLRYAGSAASLAIPYGTLAAMRRALAHEHRRAFGFDRASQQVVVAGIEVEVEHDAGKLGDHFNVAAGLRPAPRSTQRVYDASAWVDAQVYARADLRAGNQVTGPAIVLEDTSTTFVPGNWQGTLRSNGTLVLQASQRKRARKSARTITRSGNKVDPAKLEVFHSVFMSIAEQMGHVLRNTAASVNIKERLDFSCAVFDAKGCLVANAPHIPVHLGSMDTAVQEVLRANRKSMRPGDAWLLNVPYAGGTHLPDLTVVSPVFLDDKTPAFFVCSRGHHVDVGGITPGSMPAYSRSLAEEGVCFENFYLVRAGKFAEHDLRVALTAGPYPARKSDENVADLLAQLAANAKGERELRRACLEHGAATVQAFMGHIQDNAAIAVRKLLGRLRPGKFALDMDNGNKVRVELRLDARRKRATLDFTGTSSQDVGNLNAPPAVARAAICYVLRSMLGADIPLNAGLLRPITLNLPLGSMLNPTRDAAVAAGNVEVSQMVVDCLLGVAQVAAASQGTMNNLTFGDGRYQYYETVCGGAGAGPQHRGAHAIHTHMTNTLITDPEVLEDRLPVVLERFAIRRGSGGAGRQRGGNGALRTIRFLKPMEVTILANRRKVPPYGMAGGAPGKCGKNWLRRVDGKRISGGGAASWQAAAGDTLELHTPGGGGWGKPKP